jgi:hypothetical protein
MVFRRPQGVVCDAQDSCRQTLGVVLEPIAIDKRGLAFRSNHSPTGAVTAHREERPLSAYQHAVGGDRPSS